MTKDYFEQKTTWITRGSIHKPFEVQETTKLCVLTAPDGFVVKSKMFPDNDMKELYHHVNITVGQEDAFRFVNTRQTEINGITVKLLKKGTVIEFKSDSAAMGARDQAIIEKSLRESGFNLLDDWITERCEKEKCRFKPKQKGQP